MKKNINWTAIGVIAAIVIATVTAIWTLHQNKIDRALHHQHVKPDISCQMEYPIKFEGERPYRAQDNPQLIIKNNGPIKAVSVSCSMDIHIYSEETGEIFKSFTASSPTGYAVTAQTLEPFTDIKYPCMGVSGEHFITVYSLEVKYRRHSDLEPYSFKKDFFIENHKIIEDTEFKKDARFERIMGKVRLFIPVDKPKVTIKSTEKLSWFAETDPTVKSRINPDGSFTYYPPNDQGDKPQPGRPFLTATPVKYESGYYLDYKMVGDELIVKFMYEVKNTGDTAAVITEDGFDLKNTIEPNKSATYELSLKVVRTKNNEEPVENFFKLIEREKTIIGTENELYYFASNNRNYLYRIIPKYLIGKNEIEPLK